MKLTHPSRQLKQTTKNHKKKHCIYWWIRVAWYLLYKVILLCCKTYKMINHCRAWNQRKKPSYFGGFQKTITPMKKYGASMSKKKKTTTTSAIQTHKWNACIHAVLTVHLDSDNINTDRIAFNSKRARFCILYIFLSVYKIPENLLYGLLRFNFCTLYTDRWNLSDGVRPSSAYYGKGKNLMKYQNEPNRVDSFYSSSSSVSVFFFFTFS